MVMFLNKVHSNWIGTIMKIDLRQIEKYTGGTIHKALGICLTFGEKVQYVGKCTVNVITIH